jgi:predicted DCC family thiol-disulfide oxidoreductase YuxK
MVSKVFPGRMITGRFRQTLPRNVVVFDGECLYCQNQVRYMVRQNFNHDDEGHKHRLSFTTLRAPEGQLVMRHFHSFLKGVDSVIVIEKIPSRSAELKSRGSMSHLANGLGCDKPPEEDDFDVRVSIKWEAVYRASQHLDQPERKFFMRCAWLLVPHFVGDFFYDRKARKRFLHGRAERCIIHEPEVILGFKERLWKLCK